MQNTVLIVSFIARFLVSFDYFDPLSSLDVSIVISHRKSRLGNNVTPRAVFFLTRTTFSRFIDSAPPVFVNHMQGSPHAIIIILYTRYL